MVKIKYKIKNEFLNYTGDRGKIIEHSQKWNIT